MNKNIIIEQFENNCSAITLKIKNLEGYPIVDGVLNPINYFDANPKILWILKEANSNEKEDWSFIDCFSDRKWLIKYNKLPSIRRTIYVSYGILNLNKINAWKDIPYSTDLKCQVAIKSIAYINLKKHAGGASAIYKNVLDATIKNKDILKLQIETYNPDIIIFGNSLSFISSENFAYIFNDKLGVKEKSTFGTTFYKSEKRLYINAFHPSVRKKGITDKAYVMDIISIVKSCRNTSSID